MTVKELMDKKMYGVVSEGIQNEREITEVFCCDLLSIAMSKAPSGGVWVTVMANMNTLAVASLTETAVIILAEGVRLDDAAIAKAKEQGITVMESKDSIFQTAKQVDAWCHG